MDEREIINHLMDIKERLSVIESKQDMHIQQHHELKILVDINTLKITKAEASVKALRWVSGVLLVTIPATAAAIVKVFHGG